jgi:hypothetical protein
MKALFQYSPEDITKKKLRNNFRKINLTIKSKREHFNTNIYTKDSLSCSSLFFNIDTTGE